MAADTPPRRVTVSLYDSVNEFQLLQRDDAEAASSRHGLPVEIQYAEGDALRQFRQLFEVIHADEAERPLAILAEPVSIHGMERLVRAAARAGIGTALMNCTVDFLEPLREEFSGLPIFAVGTDQVEIGRIQGRQFRALLPGGGNVLYVQGPTSATAAEERLRGVRAAIEGAAIELIVVDGNWTEESAAEAVRSWRRLSTSQSTRIDLVGAQDDTMATGARRALLAEGAEWAAIPFTGIDGLPDQGQKLVAASELAATVVMPSNTGPAIDALAAWRGSGARPPARITLACRSHPPEGRLGPRDA